MIFTGKQVLEFSGIIAVVTSLIFVALELRESRLASRAASYQEVGIAVADTWYMLASDRELSEIITRAASDDLNVFESLSDEELDRARRYIIGTLRIYEVLYLQVQEGLLDEDSLRYLGFGETMLNTPIVRNLWPGIRGNITPEFREYLANYLGL